MESLNWGSADIARLGETAATGCGGAQRTVWSCLGGGDEGFCDRARPTLGRLLPTLAADVDMNAMGALQGEGAGAQSSSKATGGGKAARAQANRGP